MSSDINNFYSWIMSGLHVKTAAKKVVPKSTNQKEFSANTLKGLLSIVDATSKANADKKHLETTLVGSMRGDGITDINQIYARLDAASNSKNPAIAGKAKAILDRIGLFEVPHAQSSSSTNTPIVSTSTSSPTKNNTSSSRTKKVVGPTQPRKQTLATKKTQSAAAQIDQPVIAPAPIIQPVIDHTPITQPASVADVIATPSLKTKLLDHLTNNKLQYGAGAGLAAAGLGYYLYNKNKTQKEEIAKRIRELDARRQQDLEDLLLVGGGTAAAGAALYGAHRYSRRNKK